MTASPPKSVLGFLLILAVLTLALFWSSTGYDFVKLDDDRYIVLNPHVASGLTPANIRWAFTTVHENWWLPLLWISYMADTSLFGPGPFGYHLVNLLLHAANVLLLFRILHLMTGARWRSFFVAAFFALHPLRVESVAWIAERKDVLSGLFFFLSLLAYARYAERPGAARFRLVFSLMLLGLLSKAILVILPLLLLLLDYWPLRRAGGTQGPEAGRIWRPLLLEKIPLFALSVVFILINLYTHRTNVEGESLAWLDRAGLVFPNYFAYLGKIFWPARLSIFYPEHDVVDWTVSAVAAIGLLALTALLFLLRRKAPYGIMGWLWFLLALFPVIRGVRLGLAAYADRFVYLPSIGLSIALVWGAAALAGKRTALKIPLAALAVLLLAACAARSAFRLPDWKDSFTTLSELIDHAPNHFDGNRAYGFALMEKGRTGESLAYFARAAKVKPADVEIAAEYADALLRLGRNRAAIAWLRQALAERDPGSPVLNSLLAFALLDDDRADLAIAPLRKALASQPMNLGWRIELIRALFESGQAAGAQEEIRRLQAEGYAGIQSFDDLIPHYVNWWRGGEKTHAWHFFRNAISNQPDHVLLLNAAAWLLATDPAPPADPPEALRLAQQAVERAPAPHPDLLDTLAAAFAANGRFEDARQTAQAATDLARQNGNSAAAMKTESHLAAYCQDRPWRE